MHFLQSCSAGEQKSGCSSSEAWSWRQPGSSAIHLMFISNTSDVEQQGWLQPGLATGLMLCKKANVSQVIQPKGWRQPGTVIRVTCWSNWYSTDRADVNQVPQQLGSRQLLVHDKAFISSSLNKFVHLFFCEVKHRSAMWPLQECTVMCCSVLLQRHCRIRR